MSVTILSDDTFEKEVLQSDVPVMVDFWAEWCQPCKMVGPIVDQMAEEYSGKIKVGKMDVDANAQYPGQYGVMSIPTVMIFKGGKPVNSMIGVQPRETFKQNIESAIAS